MYLEYYNLNEKPFSLTPDPAFIYYSIAHRRAISFLRYGLQESKGFLQLTGPVGSGKTTLLRAVLDQLNERTKTAYIINPCASFPDLLRAIMKDLEISNIPATSSKLELLDFFHDYLLVQMRRNCPVILIFDESQNLSLKNLEEIRMLSNFETSKEKLLQIVFVGQPEFVKTLDLPELRQLKQRIQVRYHLSPLRLNEVKKYIAHRLQVAGSKGKLTFTDEACTSIFAFSGGIPRLINAVCDVILLIGYVTEQHLFGRNIVNEAIRELEGRFDETEEEIGRDSEPSHNQDEENVGQIESVPPVCSDNPAVRTVRQSSSPEMEDTADARDEHDTDGEKKIINRTLSQSAVETRCHATASLEETQRPSTSKSVRTERDSRCSENKKRLIPLHSFLRHRSTKRFHVGGAALVTVGANDIVQVNSKNFVAGHIIGRREVSAATPPQEDSDGTPVFDSSLHQTSESGDKNNGSGQKNLAMQSGKLESAVTTFQGKNGDAQRVNLRKIFRVLLKKLQYETRPAQLNGKVIVVHKDGTIAKGTTGELCLEKRGFQFSPVSPNRVLRKEFVLFEQICAVHIVEDFSLRFATARTAPSNPKGQQIVVVLLNGDVLEGMVLDEESLGLPRFYIILSEGNGCSWVLIEKSGTLGILCEKYRDGIYAEKIETLESTSLLFVDDSLEVSGEEAAADAFFTCNEFQMALSQYRNLFQAHPNSERLKAKTSLCYRNLAIQLVYMNQYRQAKEALEQIPDLRLREKMSGVAERLKILAGRVSAGTLLRPD